MALTPCCFSLQCKKEAVTDALKRTLRNFGSLLGNCLYDKHYTSEIAKMKAPKVRSLLPAWRCLANLAFAGEIRHQGTPPTRRLQSSQRRHRRRSSRRNFDRCSSRNQTRSPASPSSRRSSCPSATAAAAATSSRSRPRSSSTASRSSSRRPADPPVPATPSSESPLSSSDGRLLRRGRRQHVRRGGSGCEHVRRGGRGRQWVRRGSSVSLSSRRGREGASR